MAFAPTHQWRQYIYFLAKIFFINGLYYFFFAKLHHFFAGIKTVRFAGTGKKQAHEIINFGNGAYGAAWVFVGGFLLNGNYGAKAGDVIHIGPFHISHKLAGISAKAFHIAALAFVINGIKSEG